MGTMAMFISYAALLDSEASSSATDLQGEN
jgi:hypothetical protein